ncbi:hypothetical protein ACHHYP_04545 [Achlya hypogyna]|uniref:Uncharacterized protein n=1 Tax=Achlya hypogyna TaxID=1202772 RepID=A0A1V9Z0N4_ACHHY|nr:hypothetical protein ACHHYP_04545 [Achlya hypogyna]
MVHIINGEIVQDNDPRVLKIKQGDAKANYGSARFGGPRGVATVNSTATTAPPPAPATDSPFSRLGAAVGLQGTISIPAVPFLCMRSAPVEKITLVIFVILLLLLGWRALVFGAVVYYIYQAQRPAQ